MEEGSKQNIDISQINDSSRVINPFPGLRPFLIEESHLFFGREGQSDEVLLKLSENRFIGVIGPSGSGKSSFIYCGVLPILYGGFLTDTSSDWEVVVARPGSDPIGNLAQSLLSNDPFFQAASDEEQKIKKTIIATMLKSSSQGLAEAIIQFRRSTDKNYLILIDQFEELFRFKNQNDASSTNETLAFINLLMDACSHADVPIYVAITMRSDFIGECAQFPELTKKINDSHYLIPQMTREQKRRAITGPVAVGGAEIAPRLTQQLLNDLGDNPDQLPILQHALMRTWDYWSKFRDLEEEPLDIKHYEAIGTMSEALSQHANEAYDELSSRQQNICEILFKAITEKRGENFGIRRPTRLGEIADIAGVKAKDVIKIVEKFREPGRSLLTPQHGIPLSEESMIDISHESLMRIWDRLKNWVNDEADAVQMYLRLAEAATMHQQGRTGLWRPPDLHLALNWQAKHKPTLIWGQRYHPAFERTLVFLDNSKKEFEQEQRAKEQAQKRTLRRARQVALFMGGAAVVCIFFLIYAFVQRAEAEAQREEAEMQKVLAEENAIAANRAKDQAQIEKNLADLERKKAEEAEKDAVTQKGIAESQQQIAERRRIEAEEAEKRAKQEEENAVFALSVAEKEKKKAEEARSKADQLRFLAIANAMAIKSTQLTDPQLKGLLAKQAYDFYREHESYNYNPEIYDGLYYAAKSLKFKGLNPFLGHEKEARALLVLPGNSFLSGGSDGRIIRWEKNGDLWRADTLLNAGKGNIINSMALDNANGKIYASGTLLQDGVNIVRQFGFNGKSTADLKGADNSIVKLVAHEGKVILLDNGGRSLKILEGNRFVKWYDSSDKLIDIIFHPDGNQLLASAENGIIYSFDLETIEKKELIKHQSAVSGLAASQSHLAYGSLNGHLFLSQYDGEKIRASQELIGHKSQLNSLAFSHNGELLASAGKDKTVRIWNVMQTNRQPIVLADHNGWVWDVAFSEEDDFIFSASQDEKVRAFPLTYGFMANELCHLLERNMTKDEWATYVADDIAYQETCDIKLAKE